MEVGGNSVIGCISQFGCFSQSWDVFPRQSRKLDVFPRKVGIVFHRVSLDVFSGMGSLDVFSQSEAGMFFPESSGCIFQKAGGVLQLWTLVSVYRR